MSLSSRFLIFTVGSILAACATNAPETENYWEPIDASNSRYFSQHQAQCQIYSENAAPLRDVNVAPGSSKGSAAAQGFLSGMTD
jgi:hypothetical protein